MARILTVGFELNSTVANVEFTGINSTPTIVTSPVRTGTYAGRANPAGGASQSFTKLFAGANQTAPFYFRFYVRFAAFPTGGEVSLINITSVAGTSRVSIRVETGGALQLYNAEDSAQVGSSSSALSLDTWHLVEVLVDTTTIGSTAVEAKLNGTSFASGTINLALGIGAIIFGAGADAAIDVYYDDVAINDTAGSFQNSWVGEGSIIHLKPNATGDNSDWTGDNTDIDEVTPDDTTTKITETTSGEIEDVNIDATALAVGNNIKVVHVGIRFNEAVAVATDPIVVVRIKASSGGTVEESANITFNTATWNTNSVTAPRAYPIILYDLPGASTSPWTKADLDTAQIGVRLTNTPDATGDAQVSTLWLVLDYDPVKNAVFTIDGIVKQIATATFTIDGIVLAAQTSTFTIDGIVKAVQTSSFTIDGIVLAVQTSGFTIDGIVKAQQTKTFTIDGIVFATLTNAFTIDGIVVEEGAAGEETFTIDGIIKEVQSTTSIIDRGDIKTNQAASGTNITVTKPENMQVGDFIIVIININGTPTVTDNNGATPFTLAFQGNYNGNSGKTAIWYRIAEASEPATYSFTSSVSDRWTLVARAYRNVDQANPFMIAPSTDTRINANTATPSTPTMSGLIPGSVGIAVVHVDSNIDVITAYPEDGYDFVAELINQPQAVSDKQIVSESQGAVSWTLTGSIGSAAMQFALRAASPPLTIDGIVKQVATSTFTIDGIIASRVTLEVGNAIDFDGVNDKVEVSNPGFNIQEFSISWWTEAFVQDNLHSDGWNDWWCVTGTASAKYVCEIKGFVSPSFGAMFTARISGFTGATGLDTTTDIRNTGIHHFVFTASAANNQIALYQDGVLLDSDLWPVSSDVIATLTIASRTGDIGRALKGIIGEFRVFNRALTANDAALLYTNYIVPSGLILEYLFEEGSGTVANDTSGNNIDATISGTPAWVVGFKPFVIDAVVKAVQTSTYTIDGIVKTQQTSTFTIDGIVVEAATVATHTIDGIIVEIKGSLGPTRDQMELNAPLYSEDQDIVVYSEIADLYGR